MFVHVGRVLNRFSKDVGFIDALLPYQSAEFCIVSCKLLHKYELLTKATSITDACFSYFAIFYS